MNKRPQKYIRRSRARPRAGRAKPLKIKPGIDAGLKKVFAAIGTPPAQPFVPDPFQLEALAAIEQADCLVTVPTGAGKTWVALQAIDRVVKKGGRAWYASPLKALSNSKYTEFSNHFGVGQVGILTGDRKENPEAPVIVGTTEILRNQLYDAMHQGVALSADFVILDEAHFLGDEDRGVVWEEIMIYLPPRIPLLMLSATVGNAREIAAWLSGIRGKKCRVVEENKRPVPLYPLMLHPSGTLLPLLASPARPVKDGVAKAVKDYLKSKSPPLFAPPGRLPPFGKILQVLRKYRLLPAIFFLKSRADCDRAVELCEENYISDGQRKENLQRRISQLAGRNEHILQHRQRRYLEYHGVGAHHSGQLPVWKMLLEALMTDGLLDAVFATSTVAAGVNFPARTIVLLNSDRFNGSEFVPLSPTEFHQMTGRAGRRGMDRIGFAVALPGKFMDLRLVARLTTATPTRVVSQIRINFSMVLNLLLSHSLEQIEDLLHRSFAAFLLEKRKAPKNRKNAFKSAHRYLWNDFNRHFNFLVRKGYVAESGRLTPDGIWAAKLRIDQPLLLAESFRLGILPESDPALLAAVTAVFVNERESDEHIPKNYIPRKLQQAFLNLKKSLAPFIRQMTARGFFVPPLFFRPAVSMHAWAFGFPWEKVLELAECEEGDLAMQVLRTADNLRHIRALEQVFPRAAQTAGEAIEMILREPVVMDYDL